MNSQARGRRDESCALDPGEEMADKGGDGRQGRRGRSSGCPSTVHGDAQFRGMSGDEAVDLVCIARRSEHSTFITYLTVVQ